MSLNAAQSGIKGVGSALPADSQNTPSVNNIQSTVAGQTEPLHQTADQLTEPVMPGEFPSEDSSRKEPTDNEITYSTLFYLFKGWITGSFPRAMDWFEDSVRKFVQWLLPPPQQIEIYEAALKRPIASTFIVSQLICCGVPLLVLMAVVFPVAAVALLLWFILSLLIGGPILLIASMMGVSLWGWEWITYGFIKFIDQRYMGGMLARFWLPQGQSQTEDKPPQEKVQTSEVKSDR
ncbi:hypothetical protein N7474_006400 [Penicillium riverlandense]|uniref:uncharacterized protein n=1 Tax=Penicillium riverlandense TaxID=1903569 RepID=UPI002546E95F|nr:uncharacterized protein N7474_006400 [Penicillium riverlandense]KAJ5814623.1 hypothetical protein N7474_006400 [Penicillium riverlandense]